MELSQAVAHPGYRYPPSFGSVRAWCGPYGPHRMVRIIPHHRGSRSSGVR